ncbi:MAG: addiction module protein [Candidatus Acidiferrales bacterium]
MTKLGTLGDINRLPPEERLNLIERLWDSLSEDPRQVAITAAQREELDRRLDEMEAKGAEGIPWERVLEQIREGR